MRIVYVGHATTVIELDGVVLLTDPLLRTRVIHLTRLEAVRPPDHVDAVLVSHVHADHLDFRSLRKLPADVPAYVPRGAGGIVRKRTGKPVVELAAGEESAIGEVTLRAVHAEHASGRHPLSRRPVAPIGFLITGASQRAYFAGDTDLFPEMASLAPVDVALLPVSGWGPRLPAGHLDPLSAAEAVRLLQARVAIPIHWGTYGVIGLRRGGAEPAETFRTEVARVAPESEVRILQPGEATEV